MAGEGRLRRAGDSRLGNCQGSWVRVGMKDGSTRCGHVYEQTGRRLVLTGDALARGFVERIRTEDIDHVDIEHTHKWVVVWEMPEQES